MRDIIIIKYILLTYICDMRMREKARPTEHSSLDRLAARINKAGYHRLTVIVVGKRTNVIIRIAQLLWLIVARREGKVGGGGGRVHLAGDGAAGWHCGSLDQRSRHERLDDQQLVVLELVKALELILQAALLVLGLSEFLLQLLHFELHHFDLHQFRNAILNRRGQIAAQQAAAVRRQIASLVQLAENCVFTKTR